MESKLKALLVFFIILVLVSTSAVTFPLFGLSTVLGISVLSSSVLGSSLLGTTTVVGAYSGALKTLQPWLSLVTIGLLAYLELADPNYRKLINLSELRKSWLPVSALLVILFLMLVVSSVWIIIS